jgi:hypothetical protein
LITVYKKKKRKPNTINFGKEGFGKERRRIFHKFSWQNHHGFATYFSSFLIKRLMLLTRKRGGLFREENIKKT